MRLWFITAVTMAIASPACAQDPDASGAVGSALLHVGRGMHITLFKLGLPNQLSPEDQAILNARPIKPEKAILVLPSGRAAVVTALPEDNLGYVPWAIDGARSIAETAWAKVPSRPGSWTDFAAVTGGVTATTAIATFGCGVLASPGGPIAMTAAGMACSTLGGIAGVGAVQATYDYLERPLDENSAFWGRVTGQVAGGALGAYGLDAFHTWDLHNQYANYGGYAKEARSLTAQTVKGLGSGADELKAAGYQIDHVIPVKCGWVLGIPAFMIASMGNLQGMPGSINMSMGAKGC